MNATLPVLTSIKSSWDVIEDRPVVGKDVLELLSSSMYINPLSIYREYVQNSADSIEEATALGLLENKERARIDITIDAQTRNVRIRDNGTGLPKSVFVKTLVGLGASKKRGTKARGFRGVGRLAGLGYCQELVFRCRADGETEVNELRWDCRRLKSVLRDPTFAENVEDLIKEVVRVRRFVGQELPARFFEVELVTIVRHGNDCLISGEQIQHYLSQVAPVPFSPQFRYGKQIEDVLRTKVSLGNVLIYLNKSSDPIYRPHADEFAVRKGVVDHFEGIEFVDIKGTDDNIAATGWIVHHGYLGAIDSHALIKGVRLRTGNMQVGESSLLDELFIEPRFNSWAVGEIHVLDERILPNGRRDHFEQSVHFNELLNKLTPIARDLTRRCRVSSLRRHLLREFEAAKEKAIHLLSIVKQGAVGSSDLIRLQSEAKREITRMQKVCANNTLDDGTRSPLRADLKRINKRIEKIFESTQRHTVLKKMTSQQRKLHERVFALIYECSPNSLFAKALVDRILQKLK